MLDFFSDSVYTCARHLSSATSAMHIYFSFTDMIARVYLSFIHVPGASANHTYALLPLLPLPFLLKECLTRKVAVSVTVSSAH